MYHTLPVCLKIFILIHNVSFLIMLNSLIWFICLYRCCWLESIKEFPLNMYISWVPRTLCDLFNRFWEISILYLFVCLLGPPPPPKCNVLWILLRLYMVPLSYNPVCRIWKYYTHQLYFLLHSCNLISWCFHSHCQCWFATVFCGCKYPIN